MGRSQESLNKKEKEKLRHKKRLNKEQKMEERKSSGKKSFEDMLAYVDENGQLSSTPPDPLKKRIVNVEDITIGHHKAEPEVEDKGPKEGTITFFNESKGYGFIKEHLTQQSFFVHIRGLVDPVKETDKVVFEVEMSPKGPSAINVKLLAVKK